MTTDVSAALATLQLHPEDSQALKALAAVHPGNGAGIDADVAVEGAVRRAPLPPRTGRLRAGRLPDRSRAGLDDRAPRAAPTCFTRRGGCCPTSCCATRPARPPCARRWTRRPGHAAATESLAQMSLVRANWEPISKRYLQQAEGAKDPALASSLYGSVAEFHLKYRPADGEGETYLRRSLELDAHNRRSGIPLRTAAAREGQQRGAADAVHRARRPRRQPRRAGAGRGRGRRAVRQDEPRGRRLHALPQGAGREPERAARAARPCATCSRASRSGRSWARCWRAAARSKRGEHDVTLLIELATLIWKRMNQPDMAESFFRRVRKLDASNHEMVEFYRDYYTAKNEPTQLLTILAQAQKTEGDVERRVAMGIEMARAAEKRPAARREGDRDLEGDPAPQAAPARGGHVAARALHEDREVERAARAAEGRSGRRAGRRTSTKRSIVTSRSSPSIEIA